jgi:hypothetical protein
VVGIVEIRTSGGAWSGSVLTIGEVVAFRIDEAYIREGRFDTAGAHPLARCGYHDYAAVESVFCAGAPERRGRHLSRPAPLLTLGVAREGYVTTMAHGGANSGPTSTARPERAARSVA